MPRNDNTSALVDGILKLATTSAALTMALLLPNSATALHKPLNKYLKHLDYRQQERELRRVIRYMKNQNLLSGEYEYGLNITPHGRKRLATLDFDNLQIPEPQTWDKTWRIIFYDIPEEHRIARQALVAKLRYLNFFLLQRSVFVHPFPCRKEIEKITTTYGIEEFVTYIETPHIDNEDRLIKHFRKHYPNT